MPSTIQMPLDWEPLAQEDRAGFSFMPFEGGKDERKMMKRKENPTTPQLGLSLCPAQPWLSASGT